MKRLLFSEVAERLRTSLRTVRTLVASGELRAIDVSSKPGSRRPRYVVAEADLDAFELRRATMAVPVRKVRRQAEVVPNYFANLPQRPAAGKAVAK